MPGSMRILVSTPAISYADIVDNQIIRKFFVEDAVEFEPLNDTLDVFGKELSSVSPQNMFGINVPNFPLEARGVKGVAGPGKPQDELFYPPDLKRKLQSMCGKYDKWRPYPAEEPLSQYAMKMARRFTTKRCKMFEAASTKLSWDLLFYVEHSPASLAHLDKGCAMEIADKVFWQAVRTSCEWPSVPIVIFSPYGVGGVSGFSVSRNVGSAPMNDWGCIRRYVNGPDIAATGSSTNE